MTVLTFSMDLYTLLLLWLLEIIFRSHFQLEKYEPLNRGRSLTKRLCNHNMSGRTMTNEHCLVEECAEDNQVFSLADQSDKVHSASTLSVLLFFSHLPLRPQRKVLPVLNYNAKLSLVAL